MSQSEAALVALLFIWTIVGAMVMMGAVIMGTAKAKGLKWWLFCLLCGPVGFLMGLGYSCTEDDW